MNMQYILSRESEDTQRMYIYEEEGHWYAYGRSAEIIKQLQKGYVKAKQFVNNTCERVEVDFKKVIEKFNIILCSDREITLQMP